MKLESMALDELQELNHEVCRMIEKKTVEESLTKVPKVKEVLAGTNWALRSAYACGSWGYSLFCTEGKYRQGNDEFISGNLEDKIWETGVFSDSISSGRIQLTPIAALRCHDGRVEISLRLDTPIEELLNFVQDYKLQLNTLGHEQKRQRELERLCDQETAMQHSQFIIGLLNE